MSFLKYRYFLVLCEELSFQRAAHRLLISQQGLSSQIHKLEEEYGLKFFERKPRVKLTLAGEHMMLHCKHILDAVDAMKLDLSALKDGAAGKITIGTAQTRGKIFIPRIWLYFHKKYPNINFFLKNVASVNVEASLLQGDIDFYIGPYSSTKEPLLSMPLAKEELCCVVSKTYLEQHGVADIDRIIKIAKVHFDLDEFLKLSKFSYLMFPPRNRIRMSIDRYFYEHNIIPDIAFESGSHTILLKMCMLGCGITFMSPSFLYDPSINTSLFDELCVFSISESSLMSDVMLVMLKRDFEPPYIACFKETVNDVFTEYRKTILNPPYELDCNMP